VRRKTLIDKMAARLPEFDGDLTIEVQVACGRQDLDWACEVWAQADSDSRAGNWNHDRDEAGTTTNPATAAPRSSSR